MSQSTLKAVVLSGALISVGVALFNILNSKRSRCVSASSPSSAVAIEEKHGPCPLLDEVLENLRDLAKGECAGALVALQFLEANLSLFARLWNPYDVLTAQRDSETASSFNDFYKWTMFPVIRAVEGFVQRPIRVTFTVNIRDPRYAAQLVTDVALQEVVFSALQGLTRRVFDRNLFETVARDLQLPWSASDLEALCGPRDCPRTLAKRVSRIADDFDSEGEVVIRMYTAPDNKSKGEARLYVEATGPWHRVTWLETTLMQCVYSALFLRNVAQTGSSVARELSLACCRAVRSVEATNKLNLAPNLFVGRRTLGMPLMLFQTVLCAERLNNCLGTSSVDAHYLLRAASSARNLPVVGTHAHELSMVLMSLFGELDDTCSAPMSQGVGHALYYHLLKPSPLAMLPDTLNTESFLRVASALPLTLSAAPVYLKDVIGLARQDSGTLKDFLDVLRKYDFNCKLMASEIETSANLEEAEALGYASIGAGGFFGDSKKAWHQGDNISMAVKATEVFVAGVRTIVQPLKLGDAYATDAQGNKVFSKLEIDGKLSKDEIKTQKDRAVALSCSLPKNVERATVLIHDILSSANYLPVREASILVRQRSQRGI